MQQHTTQLLLPRVSKRIAEIDAANYSIPVALNMRKLRDGARSVLGADGLYSFAEDDYEDARVETLTEEVELQLATSVDRQQTIRLSRINAQLVHMLDGGSVTNVKLKSLLTQSQHEVFVASLQAIRDNTELLFGGGMPHELHDYTTWLKKADLAFAKSEKMGGMQRGGYRSYKYGAAAKLENQSESFYESAVERLEEIFSCASGDQLQQLQVWMDRDVVFGPNGNIGIENECVPRVRGSKSHQALDAGLPKLSKRLKRQACALTALRDAACAIAFAPINVASDELTDAQTLALRDKLKQLKLNNKRS